MKFAPSISPACRTGTFCAQVLMLFAIIIIASTAGLHAQGPGGAADPTITTGLFSFRPILVRVEFEGNSTISAEQLQAQIQTRPTQVPLLKRYFTLLVNGIENVQRPTFALPSNDSQIPGSIQLRRMIDSLGGEIRYLNTNLLATDVGRLKDLYNDFGHHDAEITYKVFMDSTDGVAAVHFIINEHEQYPLRAITYSGLESVPAEIREQIIRPQLVELGEPFLRSELGTETERVLEELRNNGYAFAASRPPLILTARKPEPGAPYDSAVVFIFTGKRYRFGETLYRVDDKVQYCTFDVSTVQEQREYEPGEWYNKQKVEQTIENIYGLGTYDLVTIDTVAGVGAPPDVLTMAIAARLRSPNDFRGAPEVAYEQRLNEFIWSLGASASYTRLNPFCWPAHLTLAGRFTVPFSNFAGGQSFFNRGQGGGTITLRFPTFLGIRRNSLETSGSYDNRVEGSVEYANGIATMRSEKIQGTVDFTRRLPKHTFLSSVTVHLGVQHTKYVGVRNFITRLVQNISQAVEEEDASCDSASVYQPVYNALVEGLFRVPVLQGDDTTLISAADAAARGKFASLKQTIVIGSTLLADKRDAVFAPTRGLLMEARVELGVTGYGAAVFAKGEFNIRNYSPWFNGTFASRVHVGYIQEFGELAFTPASSRFVAGGANSMRGWYERDMLATRSPVIEGTTCVDELVSALNTTNRRLLGGLMLIETSAEYRFKPFNLLSKSTIAQQFNQLEAIVFADAGNAFFRDRRDIGEVNILSNIGVDVGISLGYSTPVGPFRVGVAVPVYDPVNSALQSRQRVIFNRELLSSLVVHVGLGHAF